jgi:tripartite ATP-independent transporter DctM subunit
MTIIALLAWRRRFPREAPISIRAWPATIGSAFLPMLLPGILLGVIYSGIATPTDAAAIAAAYAILLAYGIYRSAKWPEFVATLVETVQSTASVGMIIAGAFVFNYAIASENVPQALHAAIVQWNPSPILFLAFTNVLLLALACVLDAITMLLVLIPLLVPIAVGLQIDPVFFGVLVILNMMIGLALPPHGLLLYVMSSLTQTPVGAIFREVLPFVVALLVVLIAVTMLPDLVLALPRHFGYRG